MGRCRDDGLLVAAFFIAAAADRTDACSCNASEPRSSYSEWDDPRSVPPPAPGFRIEHLGYYVWGGFALIFFIWLALQPGNATASAPRTAVDVVAAPASIARQPEPAVVARDAPSAPIVNPEIASIHTVQLPGA